ncbi:MucR family transcriptional regulator [Methylobacterium sp. J-070]|uniref:MucR family transcriptional regulator n=1 Tax=Methylobacterium sp. J-070 TaxID=2836650 RepID=UPI001FBBD9EB|nr:MucR family transcriptional regulator [Methylobacterium sp. J-070]MCJ2050635.1 MucR family transcriptional regulator [Methylobacterium sp. J-070]
MDENVETIGRPASDYTELTTSLVAAYVSNNRVQPSEIGALIASTHAALTGLGNAGAPAAAVAEKLTPAQIRKSITPDALISFIDGKPYKTLKRHLTGNGMTVEQYRERFGLPRDYPTTAASYSAMRAEFARSSRLGHQRFKAAAAPAETVPEKPKRAGRSRKAKDAAES